VARRRLGYARTPNHELWTEGWPTRDPSWVMPCIESVTERLDEHEHEHVGLIPLQEQLEAYPQAEAGQ
jgi:hypothetical protein